MMRNWIRHVDERIGNLIIFNWVHSLAKIAATWSDAELAEKLKKVPSKERQEAWIRAARKPYTDEERARRARKLVAMLDRMEERLRRRRGCRRPLFDRRHRRRAVHQAHRRGDRARRDDAARAIPRVAAWWSAIQARPAFATARIEGFKDELAKT